MVKLLLVIGTLLAVTVSRTDGTATLPTKTVKIQQNRTVLFSCVVTGESFVAWVTPAKPARPGRPAIPSVRVPASQTTPVNRKSIAVSGDNYTLTIDDVIVDDGGDYTCEGSVNSAVFTLQVDFETGQVVIKQELHLGRRGIITLNVSAYPPLTYDWKKEGQQLTFPMAGKTLDPYTGSITIDNVQESDEGNYTCTVKFGTTATVKIEVTTIAEPQIRKYQGEPVTRRLTQGYDVTFHCDVESGHPKPEVTWYFDWTGTQKRVDPVYDARYSHPTDETWSITGVETKDEGKYRCIATNKAGEDDLKFWITHVDVPPTIDALTDTIANDGDKVDLECVVAGKPIPTVEWHHRGSFYTGQRTFKRGEKKVAQISFANVHMVNTGEYTCRARNGALDGIGQVIKVEKTINLYVKSPPKINEDASPTPVYSFVGNRKTVVITCTFYGYPVPTVIMRDENGTEIARGNSSVSYTLTDTTENDFGKFNCTAENPDGMAQYLVELRKAVPPGPPHNVTANKTCNAITLIWEHPLNNGGMDIVSYIITVLSDGNQLYLENVDGLTVERNIGYSFTPKTTYEVRLKARSEVGPGKEEQLSVETDEYCVPGKPHITNTELDVDVEDFTVTWSAPLYNGGDDNLKYRLEWRKKPITGDSVVDVIENIGETQFKITGLEYNEEYEIKLFSVNRQGDSEPDMKTFKTKPATGVIGKPLITNTEVEVDTEFTVTWSAPQNHSVDNNTKYRLEWRKKPITNETEIGTEENITETRFRITGLQHNAEYEIKLYVVYRQRDSEPDVRTFKTKPKIGKPSEIQNLHAEATCNSVTLKWEQPKEDGGMPIKKYVLNYESVTRHIDGNKTSNTINNLKQSTKYNITLQANNMAEWGPSSSVEIKTLEYCAPGRPIIYSPASSLLTKNSFTLKWRRPEETGGDDDITYTVRYQVVRYKNPNLWIMKTITTKELQLKISDLDNKVQYKFEVIAKNKGGEGLADERLIQTNFSGEGSSQSRLISSASLTILVGGLLLLL